MPLPRQRRPSRPDNVRLKHVSMFPRRFLLLFGLATTVVIIVILSLPATKTTTLDQLRSSYQQSAQQAKQFFRDHNNLPILYNPTADGEDARKPPDQNRAKHRGVRWFEDERWQTQFSSVMTLDEERVVLPHSEERTPIYTYYDPGNRPAEVVEAERQVLLDWRRAWWAQGFRPVVLNRVDAQKNEKLWQALQQSDAKAAVRSELERWLAWAYVNGGILSSYLAFPMTSTSDPFLSRLRKGQIPDEPTKLGSLTSGILFANLPEEIDATLELAFADRDELAQANAIDDVPGLETFQSSSHGRQSIAIYDLPLLTLNYKVVAEKLGSSRVNGLAALHDLINAHLHTKWQSQYSSGITITKPRPEHMTSLTSFAVRIAQLLSSCPMNNPVPDSCPPNEPNCKPCSPETALTIRLSESYQDSSNTFHITPVPHPLTFTALTNLQDANRFSPRFVRRRTDRDNWLHEFASSIAIDEKLGAPQRLPQVKELVAGPKEIGSRLFFTTENERPLNLEWLLGFELPPSHDLTDPAKLQAKLHKFAAVNANPNNAKDLKNKLSKKDKTEQRRLEKLLAKLLPSESDLSREKTLFKETNAYIHAKGPKEGRVRDMVEAWNLADTEAWKFVRAINARRDKDLEDYLKEEKLEHRRGKTRDPLV